MSQEEGSAEMPSYPSLEDRLSNCHRDFSRSHTPPPPFTPEPHHPIPCQTVIRQHSFVAHPEDIEKASAPACQRQSRLRSVCKACGWALLGCMIGIALAETRHCLMDGLKQAQTTQQQQPTPNKPPQRVRDPDNVDLSKYFEKT